VAASSAGVAAAPRALGARLAEVARRALGADGARLHEDATALADDVLLRAAAEGALVVDDAAADPRTAAAPEVLRGVVGAVLAVPLRLDGALLGALAVHGAGPREWSEDDRQVLEDLAAALVASHQRGDLVDELAASRLRLGLAVGTAGVGAFDLDVRTGVLEWDDRLIDLFGYDPLSFGRRVEDFVARLHPDDRQRVEDAMAEAVTTVGGYDEQYRIVLPGGEVRWITARGHVVAEDGVAARLLGAAYDTTDATHAEAGIRRVLESMSAAFYSLDREWRFTYVNAEAERLLGHRREELLGGVVWELFPATVGSAFDDQYRGVVRTGEPTVFEAYYPAPLDRWYEIRVWPDSGGLSVYFLDVTERRAAEERRTLVAARADLLARVSTELAATGDPEAAVARLAQLVVPTLADWSVVTLVRDDGRLEDVGSWHADEDARPLVARYAASRLRALDASTSYVHQALESTRPVRIPEPAHASISALMRPEEEAHRLVGELAPHQATVFPLVARGRTLGVITLFRGADRARATTDDLSTARQLAERAGVGLDNARLHRQQVRLAEELQRSLLSAPPTPDHLEIAVRYLPAAEAARVGGDWYDAFLQRTGDTVVVIGDVVGHDTAAAAAMGQMRGLLRGIAFHGGESPSLVLAGLDAAMEGLGLDTTATAVVARVEQSPELEAEGLMRLRWSNAGHPPPFLVDPQGDVHQLLARRTDLLLGVLPERDRTEGEAVVERGSTVLLYTDGLVERRDQSLQQGLALLRQVLADLVDLPLEDLLDELLRRLLPADRADDVALLALRLECGSRPVPAGGA